MSDPYDPYDPNYEPNLRDAVPSDPDYLDSRRNPTSRAVGCFNLGCGCYTWPLIVILGFLFLGGLLGLNDGKTISTFLLGVLFFGLLAFALGLQKWVGRYMGKQLIRDQARWELEDQEEYEKDEKYRQQGRDDYYRKKARQRKG